MSQIPAGWYDDPQPAYGRPGLRWWDGQQWTEHTSAPQGHVAGPPTTPDGQLLAGWGRRLAAYLLDSLVIGLVDLLVGFPFVRRVASVYADFIRQSIRDTEAGRQPPQAFSVYGHLVGPLLGLAVVGVVVTFVYQVSLLRWRGQTVGMMALGIRVRLREVPGQLPWGTVLVRWLTQSGPQALGAIPFVGTIGSLYVLLDGLWPLWDDKRQAIHDKAAKTNVVRV